MLDNESVKDAELNKKLDEEQIAQGQFFLNDNEKMKEQFEYELLKTFVEDEQTRQSIYVNNSAPVCISADEVLEIENYQPDEFATRAFETALEDKMEEFKNKTKRSYSIVCKKINFHVNEYSKVLAVVENNVKYFGIIDGKIDVNLDEHDYSASITIFNHSIVKLSLKLEFNYGDKRYKTVTLYHNDVEHSSHSSSSSIEEKINFLVTATCNYTKYFDKFNVELNGLLKK